MPMLYLNVCTIFHMVCAFAIIKASCKTKATIASSFSALSFSSCPLVELCQAVLGWF